MTSKLPAFGNLPSPRKNNSRIVVERLLSNTEVFEKISPFYFDNGVCGHKVMDMKGAVDVLLAADTEGTLKPYRLSDFQLGNALKQALRTRYVLDTKWKITGINPKVLAIQSAAN